MSRVSAPAVNPWTGRPTHFRSLAETVQRLAEPGDQGVQQFETPWVVAATTLGVAALFNPVRQRMQLWVDRRFNRSRYDAQRVMDEFAGSLRDRVDADGVIDGWVGVVDSTMQPAAIGVWVREAR